jgi:hypothetical protein
VSNGSTSILGTMTWRGIGTGCTWTPGTHFTCFNSTKVQILTPGARGQTTPDPPGRRGPGTQLLQCQYLYFWTSKAIKLDRRHLGHLDRAGMLLLLRCPYLYLLARSSTGVNICTFALVKQVTSDLDRICIPHLGM